MTRQEIVERMLKMAENISMDSLTLYVMTNRDLEVVAAAAALLKEQEPRVMSAADVAACPIMTSGNSNAVSTTRHGTPGQPARPTYRWRQRRGIRKKKPENRTAPKTCG